MHSVELKMSNVENNDQSSAIATATRNLHPPREGFSRGTIQGLLVALPLIGILILITLIFEVRGGSGLAVTMDYLSAICAGIFIVWVVGGLFEFSGRIFDIGVKGAGGAAIVLFLAAWIRPYYNSNSFAPYKLDVTLPEGQGLAYFIDAVNSERNANNTNIQFQFGGDEALIRRFRPPLPGNQTYRGNSWTDVFEKIGRSSPCITVETVGNTIHFSVDKNNTKEITATNSNGITLVSCKS
jgi:hypothetical protein